MNVKETKEALNSLIQQLNKYSDNTPLIVCVNDAWGHPLYSTSLKYFEISADSAGFHVYLDIR